MPTIVETPVLHCIKKRCQQKERMEPDSTRLQFIKSWIMKGKGGVWMKNGSFECPNCGHVYRKHIESGRDLSQ